MIYSFEYNHCIWESGFVTISVHKTKVGAYKAMRKHLVSEYNDWLIRKRDTRRAFKHIYDKFDTDHAWRIKTIKLEE